MQYNHQREYKRWLEKKGKGGETIKAARGR